MRRCLGVAEKGWALLGLAALLVSCGTMEIRVSDPKAKIFVDGELSGEGTAEVPRMGLPAKVIVTVEQQGKAVVQQEVKREFTYVTLLLGMVSVYTGLLWAWQYPSELVLELPTVPAEGGWQKPGSVWDKQESPWDKPYDGGGK